MRRWRRSAWVLFACRDGVFPDLESILLEGRADATRRSQVFAISLLTGGEHPLGRDELDAALALPDDRWVDEADLPPQAPAKALEALARRGVVVCDGVEGPLGELRRREEELERTGWNVYGALYQLLTRWRGVDLRRGLGELDRELPLPTAEEVASFVEAHGPPPPAFVSRADARARVELPEPAGAELGGALEARRTTRSFARDEPISLAEVATVLGRTYGATGSAPILGPHVGLHKTSPSGGGLHPIEAYPLVSAVDGLEAGLYHYAVERHELELLQTIGPEDVRRLATRLVCGQSYFGEAHVSVLLAARFDRTFWKYRRNQRGLAAVLLDAGHLSQTLYLVCAELGLGAYVTTAVNGAEIDDLLGLDGVRDGSLAVNGFGRRAGGRSHLEPEFAPYRPRETGP